MSETIHYPLLVTFRDAVSGNGFLAGVTLYGRALILREEDKWWMYGVRPGAIAESGSTPQETFASFRERYRLTLFDIAEDAVNFEEFKATVENFYAQPDHFEENRWEEAFRAIRSGTMSPQPPFSDLKRIAPATVPTGIAVHRLDEERRFSATDNVPDTYMLPVAA